MIKLEKTEVVGLEPAIRGMRNPMNSWEKSDSENGCELVPGSHEFCRECNDAIYTQEVTICGAGIKPMHVIGPNDHNLMMRLTAGGPVHAKFRRMIVVYVDITAPLYWWKEFDTYKVGTVANSCSTMHKIQAKEFVSEDFSFEHLRGDSIATTNQLLDVLNYWRHEFLELSEQVRNAVTEEDTQFLVKRKKEAWWQMIQLLPSSYNQKRTVMLNYEVLAGIYPMRKNHKLNEWHDFCDWIKTLPYSEVIIGDSGE